MATMGLMLRVGEKIAIKGRTITVTPDAANWLPIMRHKLIEVAKSGGTTTYSDLKSDWVFHIQLREWAVSSTYCRRIANAATSLPSRPSS